MLLLVLGSELIAATLDNVLSSVPNLIPVLPACLLVAIQCKSSDIYPSVLDEK